MQFKEWLESQIQECHTRLEEMKDIPECEMGNVIDMIREMTLKEVLEMFINMNENEDSVDK